MNPRDLFTLPAQQRDAGGAPFPQFGPIWCSPQGPAHSQVPGSVIQLGGTLFVSNAQTALTTITTAQTFLTMAIPPGLLNQPGKLLRFGATGIYSVGSSQPQITLTLNFGGVALVAIQNPTATAAAITNGQWDYEAYLSVVTAGASGTVEAHAAFGLQQTATNTGNIPFFLDTNTAPSAAVDLTPAASGGSNLTFTIASTVSLTSAQIRQGVLELLN